MSLSHSLCLCHWRSVRLPSLSLRRHLRPSLWQSGLIPICLPISVSGSVCLFMSVSLSASLPVSPAFCISAHPTPHWSHSLLPFSSGPHPHSFPCPPVSTATPTSRCHRTPSSSTPSPAAEVVWSKFNSKEKRKYLHTHRSETPARARLLPHAPTRWLSGYRARAAPAHNLRSSYYHHNACRPSPPRAGRNAAPRPGTRRPPPRHPAPSPRPERAPGAYGRFPARDSETTPRARHRGRGCLAPLPQHPRLRRPLLQSGTGGRSCGAGGSVLPAARAPGVPAGPPAPAAAASCHRGGAGVTSAERGAGALGRTLQRPCAPPAHPFYLWPYAGRGQRCLSWPPGP